MNELHDIQNQILRKLMFSTGLRYSELKPDKAMENNQLQFHLDQLLKKNLVKKEKDLYKLDLEGKHYIKHMDNVSGKIIKQPSISVRMCCIRKSTETEYLFYTRLKHPYYGCQGFPAGKMEYGEKYIDAARRELFEETNLTGDPIIVAFTHFLDLNKKGECLSDKFYFLFIVREPKGELISSEEGIYEWVKRSEVEKKITKPFENIETVLSELEMIDTFDGNILFTEKITEVEDRF